MHSKAIPTAIVKTLPINNRHFMTTNVQIQEIQENHFCPCLCPTYLPFKTTKTINLRLSGPGDIKYTIMKFYNTKRHQTLNDTSDIDYSWCKGQSMNFRDYC